MHLYGEERNIIQTSPQIGRSRDDMAGGPQDGIKTLFCI